MAEVPEGFPTKLGDDELADAIEQWVDEYRERFPTSTLPELILAFVNTGSQEQLRRQALAATESAARSSGYALLIAAAALVVSVVSLIVTIVK